MKYILLALGIALTAMLAGCANLPAMLSGPPDPTVVQAENTAEIAELSVESFLKLQKANPDESNVEALNLARSLQDRFPQDLATLKGLLEAYRTTKSPYAKSALLPAIDSVKSSGDVAHMQLSAPSLRNRGDTFAPPMPTPTDELRHQIESLSQRMSELDRKLTILLALQRRTNSVPPPPIPPAP